jgi:excinuclease ABC subunit C
MASRFKDRLARVSSGPGVYMMKSAAGEVIYAGKAGNLKKRLASYFNKPWQLEAKTRILVDRIASFETIVTGSEKEALLLESNLIKTHKPKYNVILKDDKRYPCLRLSIGEPYPNLVIARKIQDDDDMYFGPFASAKAVRQTLNIIQKTFKLRKCKKREPPQRSRPCLNFQMSACLAPCCLEVEKKRYDDIVKEVILFLKGRTPDLIKKIQKEMLIAADLQDFERAAVLRDKMFALQRTLERQVAMSTDLKDRDVLAIARTPEHSIITQFSIRGGYLLGSRHFDFSETLSSDSEMIEAFMRQYYPNIPDIPREILVPMPLEDADLIAEWLNNIRHKKVRILSPRRGEKARLVRMAFQNADLHLKDLIASRSSDAELLDKLKKHLKMNTFPLRIECFDNANLSGTDPVAGMVVFEHGKPKKQAYRKYRIKTVDEQDDYAYMSEALTRRYGKGEKSKPYPDLLVVDGGKGQLNIAVSVTNELRTDNRFDGKFDIIGIAKKDETKGETRDKIYRPGQMNPINFDRAEELLFFLQRVRDEAHRYAATFHRKRRKIRSIRSELDEIPGVGAKRKRALLTHFGSIEKIRAASLEELSALPGMNRRVAEAVRNALKLNTN